MRLSVTCWSFPHLTLQEVAGVARALGFEALDVGYFYTSALDRARLIADPEGYAAEVRETTGLAVANLYHLFGDGLADRNLAGPPDPRNLVDLRAALRFAQAAGAPSLFVLPGVVNSGQTRMEALDASVEALRPMAEAAAEAGVALCVEPHVHSVIESPAMTEELVTRVPGLRLALDPAHFLCLGYRQEEVEPLCRRVGHVHLRQARPGVLQTKFDEGTLNVPSFLGALREAGYEGYVACEAVHQAYMSTWNEDVLTETVRLRDAVRAWLG
jgi:sugar phosphate isomerase/epimerase